MSAALMAIYAHPDDEVFGVGGTMGYYSDRNVRTILVCATRGEVGEISDPALATPETLADVREQELRCAASALGVQELIFLDYRDSGMVDTEPNQDPRAFIQANPDEAIEKLVRLIRSEKPQVVITFEPYGGYGHPDHIAISKWTTAAFHAASDASQYPNAGEAWKPSRLFYSTIPISFFREMREWMKSTGIDTSQMPNLDAMPNRFPDESITTIVDVKAYAQRKRDAAKCHATQWGADNWFMKVPDDIMNQMVSREHFALISPDEEIDKAPKADLFAGLEVGT